MMNIKKNSANQNDSRPFPPFTGSELVSLRFSGNLQKADEKGGKYNFLLFDDN